MQNLFVTLNNPEATAQDLGFEGATLFGTLPSIAIWHPQLDPDNNQNILSKVAALLIKKRLSSAYVSDKLLTNDRLWMTYEWRGKLVVDRRSTKSVLDLLPEWTATHLERHDVTILKPPASEELSTALNASEYRDMLEDPEPYFVETSRKSIFRDPSAWFGEYSDDDHGGWTTLASAIPFDGAEMLRLGNLAALGFKRDKNPDSAWAVQRSGAIRLHAVGLSRPQFAAREWHLDAGFKLERSDFQLIQNIDAIHSDFLIALQIDAPIDPTVIIGSGVVSSRCNPGRPKILPWLNPGKQQLTPAKFLAS